MTKCGFCGTDGKVTITAGGMDKAHCYECGAEWAQNSVKLPPASCHHCNKLFIPNVTMRKYCNLECRKQACRIRAKARWRAKYDHLD